LRRDVIQQSRDLPRARSNPGIWPPQPAAPMPAINAIPDERHGIGQRIVGALDGLIAFLALERSLIIRNMRIAGKGNPLMSLSNALRILLLLHAHIWGFYEMGRAMAGPISYVAYNTAAFAVFFSWAFVHRSSNPITLHAGFTKNINIKWIHLFLASSSWEVLKVIMVFGSTLLFYQLIPVPELGPPITSINVPLMCYVVAIGVVFGAGYGMIVSSFEHRWHGTIAVSETIYWIIFFTSGLYMSYATLPWEAAEILWYNPLFAPIEYSRLAVCPGYPVDDLSLQYSALVALAFLFIGFACRGWEKRTRFHREWVGVAR
jgi:ABC-type polysaccharide/polyol phosphate export permease